MNSSLILTYNKHNLTATGINRQFNYDVCNEYLLDNQDLSDTTLKGYRTCLNQFIFWLKANNITQPTKDTIKGYKLFLKNSSYTIATKNQYIRAVKHLFKWLNSRGYYYNISEDIKEFKDTNKHKRDSLTFKEIKKIIDDIGTNTEVDLRDRAIIILTSTLGLRVNEVININVNDIERKDNIYIVNILSKGQTEKNTKKAIPKQVYQTIQDYLTIKKDYKPSDALFTSTANRTLNVSDKRLSKETLSQIVKKRFRASGFDSSKITFHSLRHLTADATLTATDKNIYKTQHYLRHKNASTTEIYLTEQEDIDINLANDVYNTIFNTSEIDKTKELRYAISDLDTKQINEVLNFIKEIKGGV